MLILKKLDMDPYSKPPTFFPNPRKNYFLQKRFRQPPSQKHTHTYTVIDTPVPTTHHFCCCTIL
jgi:hypothetical protein